MGKRTDKAFDIMRERNRRYLEEQKNDEAAKEELPGRPEETDPGAAEEAGPGPAELTEIERDELKEAERKAREFHEKEEPLKLEKGDLPAMILSALLVFGPIFLVLFGILALAWIFLH